MLYSVLKPVEKLTHSMANASYSPFTGNIYFSDEYIPRVLRDLDENEDRTMMHELSHALWDSLKGESVRETIKSKEGKEWSEGFAEYGAINHFYDFLLPGKYINNHSKTIKNGVEKVRSTVEKHGQEAYLEIPNKWKEFEKELTGKDLTK
ncbi:MAG: hypothetical protein ABEI74_03365 [Candidatus Pacearchaeota archaeon]